MSDACENPVPVSSEDKPNETSNAETKETKDNVKETKEAPQTENSKPATTSASKISVAGFSEQFKAFSKFGDIKSDGKLISLSQSDKWMKQAKVIDGKTITTTDTGIYFKKLKSLKVTESDYKKFIDDLAKNKKIEAETILKKMASCGAPGLSSNAAHVKATGAVERLTDTSKYTGSHKQRFDESGKGRGAAGRKDIHDNSGYVSGYGNKDSYDKAHPTQ